MNAIAKVFVTGAALFLAANVALAGKPIKPPPASGDITEVAAGPGLEGGGTSGDVTLSLKSCDAGQVLVWDGVSDWQCMTGGDVTGVTAGSGLAGGGSSGSVNVAVMPCTAGQTLKSTGTDWVCEAPLSPAGELFTLPHGPYVLFIHSRFLQLQASDYVYRTGGGGIFVSLHVVGAGPAHGINANLHDCIEAGWIYLYNFSHDPEYCFNSVVGSSSVTDKDVLEWIKAADALGLAWDMWPMY